MTPLAPQARRKIALIGPGGVGKTTYVKRLTDGSCPERREKTLGVDVVRPDAYPVELWDTGSGAREGLGDGYLLGCDGVIALVSLTDVRTFEALPALLARVRRTCAAGTPVVIAANKNDYFAACAFRGLRPSSRSVRPEAAREMAAQFAAAYANTHPIRFCDFSVRSCVRLTKPLELLNVPLADADGTAAGGDAAGEALGEVPFCWQSMHR